MVEDEPEASRQVVVVAAGPTGPSVRLHDSTQAFVGDQVATRRNDPALTTSRRERVRNRHTWTVITAHRDGGLTVEHPQRGAVHLPAGYVAAHVELGWAVTGYGSQGDTVDVGIAVLDSTANRNHAYVAMTRGRHANHAIVIDRTGIEDPAERLAQIIGRPTSTESALAAQQRLHLAAGVPLPTQGLVSTANGPEEQRDRRPEPTLESDRARMQRRLDQLQQGGAAPSREPLGL